MKYLLPILISVAGFFAARHLKPTPSAGAAATAPPVAARADLKGLARRADLLSAHESTSVASLEKLRRSGHASFNDFMTLVGQRTEGFDQTWDWIAGAGFTSYERETLFELLADQWFDHAPDACLARVATLDYVKSVTVAGRLVSKLFTGTPEQAALVRKHLGTLVPLLGAVDASLAELPPASPETMAVVLSLPESPARTHLLRQFACRWIDYDPTAAVAWLDGQPAEIGAGIMESHAAAILQPYSKPSEAGLKLVTDWLSNKASPGALARLGPQWVTVMAKSDPAAALQWAQQHLAADSLARATAQALQMLAKDPAVARQIVEDLPPGNLRHRAAYQITEALVADDPAAVDWWLAQVDAREKSIRGSLGAPERLGQKWASLQPDAFRQRVANEGMPPLPQSILFAGVSELMSKDRPGTLEWIAGMQEKQRPILARAAYRSFAYEAPAEAAATFDARPELATGEAAGYIATSWYAKDPRAAVGWISTLPWGGPREAALAKVKEIAEFEVTLGGSIPEDLKKLLY